MSAPAPPLAMSEAERKVLERVARSTAAAHREVLARVLLAAADGQGNRTIATDHGVSAMTVRAWRSAFATEGLKHWGKAKKGRGRKPSIPAETIAEIVRMTTKETPKGETHWSSRSLAKELGGSPTPVSTGFGVSWG